jgi:MerR family transcriptional regulator, heat shock protein HspR
MPTRAAAPRLSIAEVSSQTGIPVTTLRFYERELPSLFRVRKTRGGHRRYDGKDVDRFVAVRRLTREEGLRLSEVRKALERPEERTLRQEVDLLLEVEEAMTREISEIRQQIRALEKRVTGIERSTGPLPGGRKRWFGKS